MSNSPKDIESTILPLLPLRDVVVFPHMVIPLFVGRPKSIKALEAAMEEGKNVVLVAQKSAANDEPTPEDLYGVGTVASSNEHRSASRRESCLHVAQRITDERRRIRLVVQFGHRPFQEPGRGLSTFATFVG